MHKNVKHRLFTIIFCIASIATGVCILTYNLKENISFFYTPEEVKSLTTTNNISIGGVVKPKSIKQLSVNNIRFIVTDYKEDIKVRYQGVLPNMFREGQGIVAKGNFDNDNHNTRKFIAKTLLTKHDETYKPKNYYEYKNSEYSNNEKH
ncbi:MAG: cytochrome c maturation protein CcmE [Rickettsiaceae bacterium]